MKTSANGANEELAWGFPWDSRSNRAVRFEFIYICPFSTGTLPARRYEPDGAIDFVLTHEPPTHPFCSDSGSQSTSPRGRPRAPRHPLPAEIRCYEIHRFVLSASYRHPAATSTHNSRRRKSSELSIPLRELYQGESERERGTKRVFLFLFLFLFTEATAIQWWIERQCLLWHCLTVDFTRKFIATEPTKIQL